MIENLITYSLITCILMIITGVYKVEEGYVGKF